MRLLVIHGSPRKGGYSTRFLEEAIAGYKEKHSEAEIVQVHLNDLALRGCQHCGACKNADKDVPCCIVEDDLQKVLYQTLHVDAVLWGVPNYMGDVNAQTKMLLDRYYGFSRKDGTTRLPMTQKTGVIVVQGNPDVQAFKRVEESLVNILSRRGQRPVFSVTIGGCRGTDASNADPNSLQHAREIGRQLA